MKLKIEGKEPIENIIFDFGGVILDIDISLTIKELEKLDIKGLRCEDIHPETKSPWLDLELGLVTPEQFIELMHSHYPDTKRIPESKIWECWNALLLDYDPKRIELIAKLKEHYNIYLLSNTNLPHRIFFFDKFEQQFGYRLENEFKECFYSDAMHLRKPDEKIYQAVLDSANIKGSNSLFIDDNFCNFSGAEKVGLNWYHLTGGETILDLFE